METWKKIEDFDNYEVSNFGNVKSLSRIILRNGKYPILSFERILHPRVSSSGYKQVLLSKNDKIYTRTIHQLVAIAFLNHKPNGFKLVINHKDGNRLNNDSKNLEITTNRENSSQKHLNSSSKYVGISWRRRANKWVSTIYINGKNKHLGSFKKETDAHKAYNRELSKLKEI